MPRLTPRFLFARKNPARVSPDASENSLRSAVRPVVEALEERRLLSAGGASAFLSFSRHGALSISGTRRADIIGVSLSGHGKHAMLNITVDGKASAVPAASVRSLSIGGGLGNDKVVIDPSVTSPATVAGGGGDDTLVAGSGNDDLEGGTGNDKLMGGSGNDTMNGGDGNDTLVAGNGNDVENGGNGDDSLEGNSANDHLDGGQGHDHFAFFPGQELTLDQVPAAAAAGLTTLAHGATIGKVETWTDDGTTIYGTEVTINNQLTDIEVDATGAPVGDSAQGQGQGDGHHDHLDGGTSNELTIDQVPDAPKAAILAAAGTATIDKVETWTDQGVTYYATEVQINGQDVHIVVDATGATATNAGDDHGDHGGEGQGGHHHGGGGGDQGGGGAAAGNDLLFSSDSRAKGLFA